MKLIASLTSPYARKVRVFLAEKAIDFVLEVDMPWNADTKVPNVNPLGKVPALITDSGEALYDSRVIEAFIELQFPSTPLIPEHGEERIQALKVEALADGICDAAVAIFLEKKRPDHLQDPSWIARQEGKVAQGLHMLSRELGDDAWFVGERISIADIAAGCLLGWLNLRFSDLSWARDFPNLDAFFARIEARESFQNTIPPAL